MVLRQHSGSVCVMIVCLGLAACGGSGGDIGAKVLAAPSFTLSAGPSSASVDQGGSSTTTVTVLGQNGFGDNVVLSASGLPPGVTASFNPPGTTTSSVLTLVADSTAAIGTTGFKVTGTSGGLSATASMTLTVAAAKPSPSFSLSAGPSSNIVGQGGSVTSTITVAGQNGFSGTVNLAVAGLPPGVTASFNPPGTTTSSVLTLIADSSAAIGTTVFSVAGTSGNLALTTPLTLTVAAPTLSISLSPKQAAIVSTTGTVRFVPSVTGNMGDSRVSWSVDGVAGGSSSLGTINESGVYTAPAAGGTHTISATSVALSTSTASASVAVTDLAGVFHYHNDVSQDGINTQEYALTPAAVNAATFGKLASCAVDGAVYTQPLWVPGVSIAGGTHNLLIVATQHDSVYAFDADDHACAIYWQVTLLDTMHGGSANEIPLLWNDVGECFGDIYPEVGVTGTPVIDSGTETVYLVSASELVGTKTGACTNSNGTFYHRLHALDLATGSERFNAPVTIAASVPGNSSDAAGGMIAFKSKFQHNRSALTLAGGKVYVAFAAHEDANPYHGWLFGYSATDLSQAPNVFNTTPNGGQGGIWGSGGGPAVDSAGDVYVTTGNGVFDADSTITPFNDYGDSILRLTPFSGATLNGTNLDLVGWFTPYNEATLDSTDKDLGAAAPLLLPDQTTGPPHLLAQLSKAGQLYLVDRDNMGQFNSIDNSQIVQSFQAGGADFGTPAFWQNALYFAGVGNVLKRFAFNTSTGLFNTVPSSATKNTFRFPGATPSISSNGSSNGIVWALDTSMYGYASAPARTCSAVPVPASCSGPAVLHAYDATNLAVELWNSNQASNNRDLAGNAVKFVVPTVANGRVCVSTATEIDIYGLLQN